MSQTTNFEYDLERDASASIRGYVSQVIHTVEQWLALESDAILQLEAGEDIDILTEELRTNIQVKRSSTPVTISSGLPTITNHIYLASENPSTKINTIYLTTAQLALDKSKPFAGRSAIGLWMQASSDPFVLEEFIGDLKVCFQGLRKTKKCPARSWKSFQSFLNTAVSQDYRELVQSIKWRFEPLTLDELKQRVLEKIGADETIKNPNQAFERLFYAAFERLCQRGVKTLTLTERLAALSALTAHSDSIAVANLKQTLDSHGVKLELIERRLVEVENVYSAIQSGKAFSTLIEDIKDWAAPPIHASLIRTKTLERLTDQSGNHVWINLRGESGSGKSVSARLLVGSQLVRWIKLSGTDQAERLRLLKVCLAGESGASWSDALATLPQGTFMVLDDLQLHDKDVATKAIEIAQGATAAGIRLVTTSSRPVNSSVQADSMHQIEMSAWSSDDIRALMSTYGYADSKSEQILASSLIEAASKGHPVKVNLAVSYLKDNGWNINEQFIYMLLGSEQIDDVALETAARIKTQFSEGERMLLYRLAIPSIPVRDSFVAKVAALEPIVAEPLLALDSLFNGWIERKDDLLSANALAAPLAVQLAPAVFKRCHELSAAEIAEQGQPTFERYLAMINHVRLAENYLYQAKLLHGLATQLLEEDHEIVEHYGKILLFLHLPKVNDDLLMTLHICYLQIALSINNHMDEEVAAITKLLDEGGIDERFAMHAYYQISRLEANVPFSFLAKLLEAGIGIDISTMLQMPEGMADPDFLVTILIEKARTVDDMTALAAIFSKMGKSRIEKGLDKDGWQYSSLVFDGFWMYESNLEPASRDWKKIVATADVLIDCGKRLEVGSFVVIGARIKGIVYSEYFEQTDEANAILLENATEDFLQAEEAAILRVRAALQLFYCGRVGEALLLADTAFTDCSPSYLPQEQFTLRMEALRHLSDHEKVMSFLDEAEKLAKKTLTKEHDLFRVHGERAVFVFLQHGVVASWPSINAAAELLFSTNDSKTRRSDFIQFGHFLGYSLQLLTTGSPPTETMEGAPYTVPFRGMFGNKSDVRAAMFRNAHEPGIARLMATLAQEVGASPAEEKWLAVLETFEDGPVGQMMAAAAGGSLVRRLLQKGDFDKGLGQMQKSYEGLLLAASNKSSALFSEAFGRKFELETPEPKPEDRLQAAKVMLGYYFCLLTAEAYLQSSDPETWQLNLRRGTTQADSNGDNDWQEELKCYLDMVECFFEISDARQCFDRLGEISNKVPQREAFRYLLSSLHPNVGPQNSLQLHIYVKDVLQAAIQACDKQAWKLCLTPFFYEFWGREVTYRSALLSLPLNARKWLDEANQEVSTDRVLSILSAMKLVV